MNRREAILTAAGALLGGPAVLQPPAPFHVRNAISANFAAFGPKRPIEVEILGEGELESTGPWFWFADEKPLSPNGKCR